MKLLVDVALYYRFRSADSEEPSTEAIKAEGSAAEDNQAEPAAMQF